MLERPAGEHRLPQLNRRRGWELKGAARSTRPDPASTGLTAGREARSERSAGRGRRAGRGFLQLYDDRVEAGDSSRRIIEIVADETGSGYPVTETR